MTRRNFGPAVSRALAALCATSVLIPARALAWEPETTHAGLAEQAALASRLHRRLVTLGFDGGLFEPLTVPPADAPSLIASLKLLSPTHGSVPDTRGRQTALAWLTAGAALADVPSSHGAHHFFDPATKQGWVTPQRGLIAGLSDAVREAVGRASLPDRGIAAPDWVVAKNNPFNLEAFLGQYAKAASAKTPGERSRHMAAALIAAGAILHALGDLGAPSRVRGDEAAHLEPLGAGPDDLGSRFERLAALIHGRLGVPAPSRAITRARLRDFFSASDGGGLADLIARSYFSSNTLPRTSRSDERPALVRPQPALPARLNLMAATREEGTTLRNAAGVCLARYRVEHGRLGFTIDDDCALDQIAAILPEVASYETGLLDYLMRGELTIAIAESVAVTGRNLGAGTVEVLVEDANGVRTQIASMTTTAPDWIARVGAPSAGTRVVAVFRGSDTAGEPIVAVGAMPLVQ